MQFNKSDIIFIDPSEMEMMISIQVHDHIMNSIILSLLIGLTLGIIIGLNSQILTEFIRIKINTYQKTSTKEKLEIE